MMKENLHNNKTKKINNRMKINKQMIILPMKVVINSDFFNKIYAFIYYLITNKSSLPIRIIFPS